MIKSTECKECKGAGQITLFTSVDKCYKCQGTGVLVEYDVTMSINNREHIIEIGRIPDYLKIDYR